MKTVFKLKAALALVGTLLAITPAAAIDRIGWSKTRQTMYVHGEIVQGDAALIEAAIAQNRRTLRGIILNSPGGSVVEAARFVDLVKSRDYDTGVVANGMCASACFIIWMSGRNRYVGENALVGIHSASSFDQASGLSKETMMSFVATMITARAYNLLNVPAYLIGTMVITPPSQMYYLNAFDLQQVSAQPCKCS